jgi:hypothetical protein
MTEDRINLGGGWGTDSLYARVVGRDGLGPEFRLDDLGFRLVCDNEDRVSRGSVWEDSEIFSQLPYSEKSEGDFRRDALSIRLAFDREAE